MLKTHCHGHAKLASWLLGATLGLLGLAVDIRSSYAKPTRASPTQTPAPSEPVELETAALEKALQVLVVTTPSWDVARGTAQRFERSSPAAPFHPVGSPLPAWLGHSGLAWRSDAQAAPPPQSPAALAGPRKREGDGRSPAGILSLGTLWGYAKQAPAGGRLPYKAASDRDRCVNDVSSPDYNRLTQEPLDRPPPWHSAESLRLPTDHYKYLVVLHYNTQSPQPGAGSCIFLHVAPPPGTPTAGCTALSEADLLTLLHWLDPARNPILIQLPTPVVTATQTAWHIPRELFPR